MTAVLPNVTYTVIKSLEVIQTLENTIVNARAQHLKVTEIQKT